MKRWLIALSPWVAVAAILWRQQTLERDLSAFVATATETIERHLRESMNALVGTVEGTGSPRGGPGKESPYG